jgi:hypothetical protein
VFYGSNPYRKDNPRWLTSNATETAKVPSRGSPLLLQAPTPQHRQDWRLPRGVAATAGEWVRIACGILGAWLIGLPRRAGRWLHAMNDAEAPQWGWLVTERCGGLVRQYRDTRFDALRQDPALRRDELGNDGQPKNGAQPPSAGCPGCGDA